MRWRRWPHSCVALVGRSVGVVAPVEMAFTTDASNERPLDVRLIAARVALGQTRCDLRHIRGGPLRAVARLLA
jgi:hypothetical protein